MCREFAPLSRRLRRSSLLTPTKGHSCWLVGLLVYAGGPFLCADVMQHSKPYSTKKHERKNLFCAENQVQQSGV